MKVNLSASEREQLRDLVKRAKDARVVKRAQALLWLSEGEKPEAVAQRLAVTRQTIYNWVGRYKRRRHEPISQRLRDRPRPGRPPSKREVVAQVIERVIATDPRAYGYPSPVWDTGLLRHYCAQEEGLEVSRRTIRRALRQLGYRYKRPRYVLARRAPTWRQAKGGSSVG